MATTVGQQAATTGANNSNRRVALNIGGQRFTTTVSTLTRDAESMLARLVSDEWRPQTSSAPSPTEIDVMTGINPQQSRMEEFFIDRDGHHFRHILNYLRDGASMSLPSADSSWLMLQELLREAEFYQLQGLIELVKSKMHAPQRILKRGEVVKWRQDAIDYYWRPLAIALCTEGIEYAFLFDKVGRKYNDKQTIAMCFGCNQKFLVDQVTVFDYKVRFEEWEALKQHMRWVRGVVLEAVNDTCCVVDWPNRKTLHVPITAVMPASD